MLRALLLIGMGLLSLLCMACGSENNSAADGEKRAAAQPVVEVQEADNMAGTGSKSLVVYFSATGNTAKVAKTIAQAAGADMFEIKAAQPYTAADLNYNNDNCRANLEQRDNTSRPALAEPAPDMSRYDTVYLGYPIWWGKAPMIIYTFIEESDLAGKTVVPFATSGGSSIGGSVEELQARCTPQAKWTQGRLFSPSVGAGEIGAWLDSLK